MPPRTDPTARQARLGAELRKMRESAGLNSREAGELLGGGTAKISHIESGRYGVSGTRVRHIAALYSVRDTALIDALATIAEERGKGWWEKYRGMLPVDFLNIAELEHHAKYLRTLELLAIPGIFQTEDYARAIFTNGNPGMPDTELSPWIEHRVSRRRIFDKEPATEYEALIHEAALRIPYGSRKTTRAQLEYLVEVCEWPGVTIRVIPFDIDAFHGDAQSMLYAGGPIEALDTVQLDGAHGGAFLDAPSQLRKYREVFGFVERISLTSDESRNRIRRFALEM
jgi:transcriptional regulator with XRE-family HTH domain